MHTGNAAASRQQARPPRLRLAVGGRRVSVAGLVPRRRRPARAVPGGGGDGGGGGAEEQALAALKTELNLPRESELMGGSATPGGSGSGSGNSTVDSSVPPLRPAALAPGTVVGGRYTIESQLGAGANAITYRARDGETGEHVSCLGGREKGGLERPPSAALHSLPANITIVSSPAFLNSPLHEQQVAVKAMSLRALRDWKQLELFQREAVVLQSLSHPGVPRYLGYFEEDAPDDRCFYIVQTEARGASLAEMLRDGKRADEAEALRIATELLSILKYLGGLRPPVVHRDIKPENVVLEGGEWGGRVFLLDFGGVQGAAPAGETFASSSTVVGSYGYMAPEQFR